MSAWYVFTALGFYPVTPASDEYAIGRPFVPKAVLHLPNGHRFTIVAEHLGAGHPYVGRITLNGKPLNRSRHQPLQHESAAPPCAVALPASRGRRGGACPSGAHWATLSRSFGVKA